MNKREFDRILNECSVKKKIDIVKVKALPESQKIAMILHIVKMRVPLLTAFIDALDQKDMSWLHSCGYMYITTGKQSGYEFLHTCEHQIV